MLYKLQSLLASPSLNVGFVPTPLRSIITSRAFISSILNTINDDFITNTNTISDIFQDHMHIQTDLIYTSVFLVSVYLQIQMYNSRKKNWDNITLYKKYRRQFNMILLILFIILTRNVENAI
jgi:hypothetical protein